MKVGLDASKGIKINMKLWLKGRFFLGGITKILFGRVYAAAEMN